MAKIKLNFPLLKRINKDKVKNLILLALPFLLMDIFIRTLASSVNYHMGSIVFPNILFTVNWIVLILALSLCFNRKIGRIIYGAFFALYFVLFLTHTIYYPYTGFFFSLNLLQSASEGSAYIWDTICNAGTLTYLKVIVVLSFGILAIVKFPKGAEKNKSNRKVRMIRLCSIFLAFVAIEFITPMFLGKANDSLQWDTWRNPRNVYDNFSDSNKTIKICGFYQYSFRDFYVTCLRPDNRENPEEKEYLKQIYKEKTLAEENEFTGVCEGKNVIFLQLEGIDSWLFNEVDMPVLSAMKENAIVYDNHFSYYTGGGSTFNSELAVNTGFITPISYTQNPYSFNKNSYPGSLPRILKREGYKCNAFHMNSGEYYMRELNYKNWGYDNYYGLMDEGGYKDVSYQLDTELVENKNFYKRLFNQKEPFMHYIISYTPHTPFSLDSEMGKLLTKKIERNGGVIPKSNDEETVARFFATETDRMIGLLMEGLEDNGLLENTIIVAFADHYLYTLNDKSILDKNKPGKTENNLINHTPFLIWSKDFEEKHVNKVNSQIDILPTVLNMLGVKYCNEHYIGRDIMDRSYSGYVFFSDYSWYDGKYYIEFGDVPEEETDEVKQYIIDTNALINNKIRKNDLTLKYNYFKK